jgi:hypothetical protein
LVAKVEEAVQAQAKDGSAKGFREDENCLLVREGCNKNGRFLEVAVEGDGGRKGTIWLLEGRKGWGWRRFASEMRRMLEFQGGQIGPIIDEYPSLPGKQVEVEESASAGSRFGRSFANVLRSTVGGFKRVSSCLLDVFPVSEKFEAELGGVEHRSAVDCYAMEAERMSSKELVLPPPASVSLAAANMLELVPSSASVSLAAADMLERVPPSPASVSLAAAESLRTSEWVKLQLGFFGLIGLSAGLELKPKGVQNKAERLGHAGPVLGAILGLVPDPDPIPKPVSDPFPDPVSDPNPDPISDPNPDPVSDPTPEMGFSCDSGSDLSDPFPATSFPGLSVMPHLELGAATATMGEEASDFTSESHFGLTKSQKWLLASLREAVQHDATHLELLKDMEEAWRQARKEAREVLSTEEEERNLASLKEEFQWFLGGRKGPQTRSKGKREHRRVESWRGKTNVG